MKRIIAISAIGIAGFMSSCTSSSERRTAEAQQKTIDSLEMEVARQRIIDSMNAMALTDQEMTEQERVAEQRETRRVSASGGSSGSYSAYRSTDNASPAAPQVVYRDVPVEQEKKGWSAKGKGAAIGAGAGALGGALLSNKKGKGALIGGAAGAVLGLGTGAIIDANKKKKEEERRQQ